MIGGRIFHTKYSYLYREITSVEVKLGLELEQRKWNRGRILVLYYNFNGTEWYGLKRVHNPFP